MQTSLVETCIAYGLKAESTLCHRQSDGLCNIERKVACSCARNADLISPKALHLDKELESTESLWFSCSGEVLALQEFFKVGYRRWWTQASLFKLARFGLVYPGFQPRPSGQSPFSAGHPCTAYQDPSNKQSSPVSRAVDYTALWAKPRCESFDLAFLKLLPTASSILTPAVGPLLYRG